MSNSVDLLGNDVEDEEIVFAVPKVVVKDNKSTKKSGLPPASATPLNVKKSVDSKWTGNELLLRDTSVGREQNKLSGIPASSSVIKINEKKTADRHSRTGKIDTPKRIHSGWGDNSNELYDELIAKRDADNEFVLEHNPNGYVRKSLDDCMHEITLGNDPLKKPSDRKLEIWDEDELRSYNKDTARKSESSNYQRVVPLRTEILKGQESSAARSTPRSMKNSKFVQAESVKSKVQKNTTIGETQLPA